MAKVASCRSHSSHGSLLRGRRCKSPSPRESPGIHDGATELSTMGLLKLVILPVEAGEAPFWAWVPNMGIQNVAASAAATTSTPLTGAAPTLICPVPLSPAFSPLAPKASLSSCSSTESMGEPWLLLGAKTLCHGHTPSASARALGSAANALHDAFATSELVVISYCWLQDWAVMQLSKCCPFLTDDVLAYAPPPQ